MGSKGRNYVEEMKAVEALSKTSGGEVANMGLFVTFTGAFSWIFLE